MDEPTSPQDALVISHLQLRRALGFVAALTPWVLVIGNALRGDTTLHPSISHTYYSPMRDVFVGSLFVMAAFLAAYRGYADGPDDTVANMSALFAVGVALFPTSPDEHPTRTGTVHYVCAALMFLCLAYFCLVLFRRSAHPNKETPQKKRRNQFYMLCGVAILVCMALMGLYAVAPGVPAVDALRPVFFLESVALMAFGASWVVKSEFVLKDDGPA